MKLESDWVSNFLSEIFGNQIDSITQRNKLVFSGLRVHTHAAIIHQTCRIVGSMDATTCSLQHQSKKLAIFRPLEYNNTAKSELLRSHHPITKKELFMFVCRHWPFVMSAVSCASRCCWMTLQALPSNWVSDDVLT